MPDSLQHRAVDESVAVGKAPRQIDAMTFRELPKHTSLGRAADGFTNDAARPTSATELGPAGTQRHRKGQRALEENASQGLECAADKKDVVALRLVPGEAIEGLWKKLHRVTTEPVVPITERIDGNASEVGFVAVNCRIEVEGDSPEEARKPAREIHDSEMTSPSQKAEEAPLE